MVKALVVRRGAQGAISTEFSTGENAETPGGLLCPFVVKKKKFKPNNNLHVIFYHFLAFDANFASSISHSEHQIYFEFIDQIKLIEKQRAMKARVIEHTKTFKE